MIINFIKRVIRRLLLAKTTKEKDIIQYKNNAWNSKKAASHYKKAVETTYFEAITLPIFKRYMKSEYSVLDVGCGTGRLTSHLIEEVSHVTAIDYSKSMVDLIDDHPKLTKHVGDAHSLEFADGTFDAVYSMDFLSHFPSWKKLIIEQVRVLAPGGLLVCNYITKENTLKLNERHYAKDTMPVSVSEMGAIISRDDLIEICSDYGCELIKLIPYGFLWGNDIYSGFMSKNDAVKISTNFLEAFTANQEFRNRVISTEQIVSATENPLIAPRGIMVIQKND